MTEQEKELRLALLHNIRELVDAIIEFRAALKELKEAIRDFGKEIKR